jgi:uncharacterized membrane protein YccC
MTVEETKEGAPATGSAKSIAIKAGVWSLVTIGLAAVIDNQSTIAGWIQAVTPDAFDPLAGKAWAMLVAGIMLFVGPSRNAPLKKLYTGETQPAEK